MEEFKGTPGPWIKATRKGKILAIIPKRYGERVIETVFQTGHISDDDCGVETCCCVEEHANANLIAAAPELLKACQSAIRELQLIPCKCDESVIKELEKAITKALGGNK